MSESLRRDALRGYSEGGIIRVDNLFILLLSLAEFSLRLLCFVSAAHYPLSPGRAAAHMASRHVAARLCGGLYISNSIISQTIPIQGNARA